MTSALRSIEIVAEKTGISRAKVARIARSHREYDPELWPQGSHGRGQEAHVSNVHLINLILGLVASDSAGEAPAVAALYGALECDVPQFLVGASKVDKVLFNNIKKTKRPKLKSISTTGSGFFDASGILASGEGLGVDLINLVERLSNGEKAWVTTLQDAGFSVALHLNPEMPEAVISYYPDTQFGHLGHHIQYASQKGLRSKVPDVEARIISTKTLPLSLFVVLADI